MALSKRQLLLTAAGASVLPALPVMAAANREQAQPFPLEAVTLTPSLWRTAVDRNAEYLLSLEPDRFLHNFRISAGLAPRGEVYGGWEAMGIAGHSLGHYLSACGLMYAQVRDDRFRQRIAYIVGELAACQAAHGDGYVSGTTVERDGKTVDGKIVFEEVRAHTITTHGFDINGGWVPLYTWHKVHAGLLDAHRYAGNQQALDVCVRMSDYLIGVLGGLGDDEMQQVLAAEHGGLNETFAETYARTGQKRFLAMSERIYHKAILDPLAQGRDELDGKHANTQIPKLIGLARLYEITGKPGYRDTAAFFWDTVTKHHSYVIGGNADSEHFGAPDAISAHISDKTCEACNSYNILKLTRHLYTYAPDAKWFDFYERAHLNHIMAAQDPDSGLFVYFMPLHGGSERVYSTPTNSFWCCVGSGMESHAKHGDSIWWRSGDTAFVNLFIPSEVTWTEQRASLRLETGFPHDERVTLHVEPQGARTFEIAVRLPGWCDRPSLSINGQPQAILARDGYARLRRTWRKGDVVTLDLPQSLKVEYVPDNRAWRRSSRGRWSWPPTSAQRKARRRATPSSSATIRWPWSMPA
ncbi:MAG: glycoside hydrolase family 127 protein [Asticcacaulis sp.]